MAAKLVDWRRVSGRGARNHSNSQLKLVFGANLNILVSSVTLYGRSRLSMVIYRAGCWECKTKRIVHDRNTERFKAPAKRDHPSTIADHITFKGNNIK